MSLENIGTFISLVGFPIAAYCGLFWYIVKENRENRSVIQNNTTIITRILERLDREDKTNE